MRRRALYKTKSQDNPTAFYSFEETGSSLSNGEIIDSSGYGFNGNTNQLSRTTGKTGQGILLDSSKTIDIPYSPDFSLSEGKKIAWSFWVKFTTVGDAWFFSKRGSTSNLNEYQFSYYLGNLRFSIWSSSSELWQLRVDNKTFQADMWYLLEGWADPETETGEIFENGISLNAVKNGELINPPRTTSVNLDIGHFNNSFNLNGVLDEFKLYIGEKIKTDF